MQRPVKAPPRLGIGKRGLRGGVANDHYTAAADIAHALEARQVGPGKWMARCPAHEDRTPSLSIREGDIAPLVHCFGGCDRANVIQALRDRGLWLERTPAAPRARCRRLDTDKLWREAARHLTHGTRPRRRPPYARTLPATGEVWIMVGAGAWEAANLNHEHGRHCLVWPSGTPSLAYAWPVRGRDVRIFEVPGEGAVADPEHAETLVDFARLLVSRWRAATAEVFADGSEPVRVAPGGDCHAA